MAKGSIDTGLAAQAVHTRTTADAVESQAVVLVLDGSDSIVPAHATDGLGVEIKKAVALSLDATTLAALETIGLDAATLAALESISITGALPAGTNAIGKLAANSGVDIGDVDVTSLPAIPAGTNNIGDVDVLTLPAVASASVTQVASSATSVTLKASNAARKGLSVFNDSTSALFVKFGATASATSFTVKIAAAGYFEMAAGVTYTGVVDGIWSAAAGNAYVTEL